MSYIHILLLLASCVLTKNYLCAYGDKMKKALLFDDDEGCRKVIIAALADYDIKTEAHHDPTCFLKKADKCPVDKPCVDIIITDNQMPNMTGLDFLKRLDEMECEIPARNKAIISGDLSKKDLEKIEKLGSIAFNKPCSLTGIYDWLEEIGIILRQTNC